MFEVQIRKNMFENISTLQCSGEKTIKELITGFDFSPFDLLSFKLNNKFVNSNTLVSTDAVLDIITFDYEEGLQIYQDSAIFILAKAFKENFPKELFLLVKHSIADGIYCEIKDFPAKEADIDLLGKRMIEIVNRELYIENLNFTIHQALEIFSKTNRPDIVSNLLNTNLRNVNVFRCENFYDYYVRPLCDNTGLISSFKLELCDPGFILRFPNKKTKVLEEKIEIPHKLMAIHREYDSWLDIINIQNLDDLNSKIENYEISKAILVEEALHENKIVKITDEISRNNKIKFIMIAGPSSSGKTTFAKRICIQLQVNRICPSIIELDNYFLPRTKTPKDDKGDYDFESIYALDLDKLNKHLSDLLKSEEVELPFYNFVSGTSEPSGRILSSKDHDIVIIEGIHALNEMISASIPRENKIKIYISSLNQLNIDNHNRIPTNYSRRIRRIVRDHYFRGYDIEKTLLRWPSVRKGENRNIFPFQEDADIIFNSGLSYEIAILKKHILPLVKKVRTSSPVYTEIERIVYLLKHVNDIPDHLVPNNSILKEFIGNSIFDYQ